MAETGCERDTRVLNGDMGDSDGDRARPDVNAISVNVATEQVEREQPIDDVARRACSDRGGPWPEICGGGSAWSAGPSKHIRVLPRAEPGSRMLPTNCTCLR